MDHCQRLACLDEAYRSKRDGRAVSFRCLRPGCPAERGPRRLRYYHVRMLWSALFLFLAVVLLSSLVVGVRDLNGAPDSESGIAEPSPVARAELVHLMG